MWRREGGLGKGRGREIEGEDRVDEGRWEGDYRGEGGREWEGGS